MPSQRARARAVARGRPHARRSKITPENLKNQQDVVKNEVRVNVLNQPYGGFPWLDLPQNANTNWYNAHNFYGDLSDLEAATLEDVQEVLQDLLRAEQRRARGRRRHDARRGDEAGGEALRRHPVAAAAAAARYQRSRRRRPRRRSSRATSWRARRRSAFGYHLPERMTKTSSRCRCSIRCSSATRARSLSGAHQGEPGRVGRLRRVQLRARQQLRLQRPDALHVPRRLPSRPQGAES